MDLISIIAIIIFITKIIKKAGEASDKVETYHAPQNTWRQASGGQSYKNGQKSSQNEEWRRLARENIEKARRRASEKLREVEESFELEEKSTGTYQMSKKSTRTTPAYEQLNLQQMAQQQKSQHRQMENRNAMQQVHAGRMEARKTSILERAKINAEEDRADVTLETMEAEHNHSERVSSAEHYHPEDVMPESMLGTIEDLMIKGYDCNRCFERDFVGEAMDMISRFTVPSDVPDFGKDDVA